MKIVLSITGASGSIYAKRLIYKLNSKELSSQVENTALVFSETAISVWKHELGAFDRSEIPFKIYNLDDYNAPFASGSAGYDAMVICPCSMGTIGRIANGVSDSLIGRAADVMLKERRRLILVPRETPLSLIHINNLKTLTEAGAIILPAMPSFYSKAQTVNQLVDTVVDRILTVLGLGVVHYEWGN